jgi:hypothetical protein
MSSTINLYAKAKEHYGKTKRFFEEVLLDHDYAMGVLNRYSIPPEVERFAGRFYFQMQIQQTDNCYPKLTNKHIQRPAEYNLPVYLLHFLERAIEENYAPLILRAMELQKLNREEQAKAAAAEYSELIADAGITK